MFFYFSICFYILLYFAIFCYFLLYVLYFFIFFYMFFPSFFVVFLGFFFRLVMVLRSRDLQSYCSDLVGFGAKIVWVGFRLHIVGMNSVLFYLCLYVRCEFSSIFLV